ncbi:hypothetical protein BN946_scf184836.g58 [Trametes cinnabarina]|uniref:Uncharacterized protein n=1 Tax=Pycnoporus cinnabarinus TaxID=5643 RepID=A0A060SCH7_PYCCI|nr:hypothetical protein BN946_scf184836.g58 [Trametes cinnabarina]
MGSSTTPYKRQYDHQSSMLSALSVFVHRILRYPMADNQPTLTSILHKEPGTVIHVTRLTDALKLAYEQAVRNHGFSPDRARVCQLSFMKERLQSQHEYILAYVTIDGQPWAEGASVRLGIIRCERTVDSELVTPKTHAKAVSSNTESSSKVSGTSSPSSQGTYIAAADQFILFDPTGIVKTTDVCLSTSRISKPNDVCLYEHRFQTPAPAPPCLLDPAQIPVLQFSPPETCPVRSREDTSPPSLYDLAAAALALNTFAPQYVLLRTQCYWFAAMFFYLLGGNRAADDKPKGTIPDDLVFHGTKKDVTAKEVKEGTFYKLLTLVTEADVKKAYDTLHEAFDGELTRLYGTLRCAVEGVLQQQRDLEQAREEAIKEKDRADRAIKQAREEAIKQKDRADRAIEQAIEQKDLADRALKEATEQKDRAQRALAQKDLLLAQQAAQLEALRLQSPSQAGQPGPSRAPQA